MATSDGGRLRLISNALVVNSSLLVGGATLAWMRYKQFYPTTVRLIRSPTYKTLAASLVMLLLTASVDFVRWLTFGALDRLDVEEANERLYATLQDTLLGFRTFQNQWTTSFTYRMVVLFGWKYFHWLTELRIGRWGTVQMVSARQEVLRLSCILFLFCSIDGVAAFLAVRKEWNSPYPTTSTIYAVEFFKLSTLSLIMSLRFLIAVCGMGWITRDDSIKGLFLQVVSLLQEVLLWTADIAYGTYLMKLTHKLPLNVVRPVYLRAKKMYGMIKSVWEAWCALRYLDNLPTADQAEIDAHDRTCAVCREDMIADSPEKVKKLNCNHILHLNCIRSWMEQQRACPTCRHGIFDPPPELPAHDDDDDDDSDGDDDNAENAENELQEAVQQDENNVQAMVQSAAAASEDTRDPKDEKSRSGSGPAGAAVGPEQVPPVSAD